MSADPHAGWGAGSAAGYRPLIGRHAELTTLLSHTAKPGPGLVTLVGPSGVGKTRLAEELVRLTDGDRGRHALLVPLHGVADASLLADEIVAHLPGNPGLAATVAEALWEHFDGGEVLLVLDDLDRLQGAAESVIGDLSSGYPRLRVVATSVRPLNVPDEQLVRVRPFPTVETDSAGLNDMAREPALALFVERATAVDAAFSPSAADLVEISSICAHVGGLPLAIELAASRTATFPPSVIARQLSTPAGLALLRDGTGEAAGRHGSMESTLQWSYDLLTEGSRSLLSQLAVFEGTFSLEAAARVVDPEPENFAEMLDWMTDLIDFHLVELWSDDPEVPRFHIPTLVRSFAQQRLVESGAEAGLRSRHARYFQTLCQSGRTVEVDEVSDVLAALDRAMIDGNADEALHAAIAASRGLASYPGVASSIGTRIDGMVRASVSVAPDGLLLPSELIRSSSDSSTGDVGTSYVEWSAARVRDTVAAARRSGSQAALLEALHLTVHALPTTLDAQGAVAAAHEGLALAREMHDEPATMRFEIYSAMAAQSRGDFDEAARLASHALAAARAANDVSAEISASIELHRLRAQVPVDFPTLQSLDELLEACENIHATRAGRIVLVMLSARALASGDVAAANRYTYQMLLTAAGLRRIEPMAPLSPLMYLVMIAASRGDREVALRLHATVRHYDAAIQFVMPPRVFDAYRAASEGLCVQSKAGDPVAEADVASSLDAACRYGLDYSRSILEEALDSWDRWTDQEMATDADELTPREREVLFELATGKSNKQIAVELSMSPKTVTHHTVAIYRKLGVRGRGEATVWAHRAGLVDTYRERPSSR